MSSKTHLASNVVEMSPRRRSIVPQFASTPYIANDDEVERFKRRTNSELQKRVSNLSVVNRSTYNSDNEGVELNESKLQEHYQTCVKLFTENKINAKNAWNVHIVEYMQTMLNKGLVMKDTLKLASTSLDIGTKVYCLKVDQVHSDLFKLANAMARVNVEENANNDNDDGNESGNEPHKEAEGNKKKEKKKKKLRSYDQDCELTVVTDESTLNGNIVPHNTAVQQISSGKSRLYTLSTITKQRWGFEQMVSCRSNFPYFSPLKSVNDNVKLSDKKVPVTIPVVKAQICPSFTDFIIDRWQPDDDDVPMGTQGILNSSHNIVYDDNGLPIPNLDASVHELNDNDHVFEDAEDIVETAVGHEVRRPVAFITEMRPGQGTHSDVPLQYSYRSAPVVSDRYMLSGVWAGPSHWKIKSLQRRTQTDRESVNVATQRAKRGPKKSEPEIIRFDIESDIEEEALIPLRKNKKKKRVRRGSLSKVTLPEDLGITINDLCTLRNNPEVRINVESAAAIHNANTSRVNLNMTANYQYDNPDDADYCSQTINDNRDGDDDYESNNDNDNVNNDPLQQTLTDENMVNVPNQVQKFQVPYATQAKRMDMRKLKDAIWKTMAISNAGNDELVQNEEELKNIKLHKIKFSSTYTTLPSHITARMAEELTAPLAFVALLHLANEETLKLDVTSELNDIFISTDK